MFLASLVLLLQVPDPLGVTVDKIRSNQDILHYSITLQIPDRGREVRGSARIEYRMLGDEDVLELDFDDALAIDSVISQSGSAVRHEVAGDRLTIYDPEAGETASSVTVYYHGTPGDGLFIQDNVHGERTAFADNWPDRAHHWFPSEDHPSDKATVSFRVEVPAGWKVIANGTLGEVDTTAGGRTAWTWAASVPIPVYTMVLGAGPMSVTELQERVPQSVWTFREDSAFAVNGPFKRAADILAVFSRWIGPFPYSKLAHVESSTRFGGMENSSAIFYNESAYMQRTLGEGTVAHEIAHQWFGDAVTEYDWHHLWLSEGFATYWDPLYNMLKGERQTFVQKMEQRRTRYMESDVVGRPIIDTSETDLFRLLNANNYQKGSWVLHMLRGEIGDSAFFQGVRDYYHTFRDSTVLSRDFEEIMERHADRDLSWFFRQWLLQPGYPKLAATTSSNGEDLIVRLVQVQPDDWGSFRLDVPVKITQDRGQVLSIVVPMHGGRVAMIKLKGLGTVPAEVELDPDRTLLLEQVSETGR